jgi:PTH1 family peptidyl-tRNA hydrolase
MVAHIKLPGRSIALVKPLTYVNASGPALSQLGKRHAFSTADCVLVHDDLDLPLGAVRICERGSDGGHRGVRSIFDSFQTDEIRRVRIGVGQPGEKAHPSSYVLTPFSPSQAPVIERSCAEAADWLRRLLTDPAVR